MDESPLIDLAPRTSTLGPGGAASSRVLIFLKGSDVETRAGGLFFEKFDYLQVKGDVPRTHANISKARCLLGYQPATRLREGMASFVRWFQDENASRFAT